MEVSRQSVITIQKCIRGFLSRKKMFVCNKQYAKFIHRSQSVFNEAFQRDSFGVIDVFDFIPKNIIKHEAYSNVEQKFNQVAIRKPCINIEEYADHSESPNFHEMQLIKSNHPISILIKPLMELASCQIFSISSKPLIEIELLLPTPIPNKHSRAHETQILFQDPQLKNTESSKEIDSACKIPKKLCDSPKSSSEDIYTSYYFSIIKPYVEIEVLESFNIYELPKTIEVPATISEINFQNSVFTTANTELNSAKKPYSFQHEEELVANDIHVLSSASSKKRLNGPNSGSNSKRRIIDLKRNSEATPESVKLAKIEFITNYFKSKGNPKGSTFSPPLSIICSKINPSRTDLLPPLKSPKESTKHSHNKSSNVSITTPKKKKVSKTKLKLKAAYGAPAEDRKLAKSRDDAKKKNSESGGLKRKEASKHSSQAESKIKLDDYRATYGLDWNKQIFKKYFNLEAKIQNDNQSLPKLTLVKKRRSRIKDILKRK